MADGSVGSPVTSTDCGDVAVPVDFHHLLHYRTLATYGVEETSSFVCVESGRSFDSDVADELARCWSCTSTSNHLNNFMGV